MSVLYSDRVSLVKELHCPTCGSAFVRVTREEAVVRRLLNHVSLYTFRCQLCTNQFRAFRPGAYNSAQAFDRRQFKRLTASIPATYMVDTPQRDGLVVDLSMGGCTLQTNATLPRGTFMEVVLKPHPALPPITVETAMVSSLHSASMGIRFLEFRADDKQRLCQLVLKLLVSQTPQVAPS